MSRANFSWTN